MMSSPGSALHLIPILCFVAACSGGIQGPPSGDDALATPLPTPATPLPPPPFQVPHRPSEIGHPTFASPHSNPIVLSDGRVFVVNTPSDTVDVIDAGTWAILARINVGIDPVGIGLRPDGEEIWVSNHISDSVSVIDTDTSSPTYLQVIATVQDFDPTTKATRFDEPVGVAFASNDKVYVALSSENRIAVIDVPTRQVVSHIDITAQDPRAISVHGDRLYVIPFESNNRTQISGGYLPLDGVLKTFDAQEHVLDNNNVLSLGIVVDIVKHPLVPDRDLYVFDTTTDLEVEVVETLGTLLYGLTVDSTGQVFVAQTDARNDANGKSGTLLHGLAEMENRAFLNQVTRVPFVGDVAQAPEFIDLEPLPPFHPDPGQALATPFGIQISDDDSTLVVTAAGSDMVFTVDAMTGLVLGRVEVDAVPRGVALVSAGNGAPFQAWVLNALSNTVSLVDVFSPNSPTVLATIPLEDPTHPVVKSGRIAFNDAGASSTKTFSCESCHPDGHTDQLVWVLDTPIVSFGDQIQPRTTMPARGLRDSAPYHWDGIPGDPYGGNNASDIFGDNPPNSDIDIPESSTRFLVDGGLASTMLAEGDATVNDEGLAGALSGAERDDLAKFLLSLPYPPAQRRSFDNVVSNVARSGFELFHVIGDDQGGAQNNVCGDCHRMPLWTSTNTPGFNGMDAPTWRGAYDRWMILPQGRLNLIDFAFYEAETQVGTPEDQVWNLSWGRRPAFAPVWNMVLEGSTGFSGSFARQVTLSQSTAGAALTQDLFDALELSASEKGIVLQGEGVFINGSGVTQRTALEYALGGKYVQVVGQAMVFTRAELFARAAIGEFVGTFTGRLGQNVDFLDSPQPTIWCQGPIHTQGRQQFPTMASSTATVLISARHVVEEAHILVDGRQVPGSITIQDATHQPRASFDKYITVQLNHLPTVGMHLLQVQNPDGLFSNDFIFYVEDIPIRRR